MRVLIAQGSSCVHIGRVNLHPGMLICPCAYRQGKFASRDVNCRTVPFPGAPPSKKDCATAAGAVHPERTPPARPNLLPACPETVPCKSRAKGIFLPRHSHRARGAWPSVRPERTPPVRPNLLPACPENVPCKSRAKGIFVPRHSHRAYAPRTDSCVYYRNTGGGVSPGLIQWGNPGKKKEGSRFGSRAGVL